MQARGRARWHCGVTHVSVIPQILSYIEAYNKLQSKQKTDATTNYGTHIIKAEDKYKFANCEVFKKLAIYYEKSMQYDDALRICDLAISIGYLDDGTKMGILGRKSKILKKMGRSDENG